MDLQKHPARALEDSAWQLRYSALFALCACMLVLALPKSTAAPRPGVSHPGVEINGVQLNGFKLNGYKLNGFKLNTIRLNTIQLNGTRLSGSAPGSVLADPPSDAGLVVGSANLVGITLSNGERISH
jgi:hypothetical protein